MTGNAKTLDGHPVDVKAFIDQARFGGYQKWLLVLCFATVFFDGFNVQALAVAAPMIKTALKLSPVQVGTLLSAGSLGGIIAGFAITPVADRIGRRPLIVWTVLISGLLTLLYTVVNSLESLLLLRVVGGFFLAIAVTVVYAYAAEFAPKRLAATTVIITTSGFGLGVAATGFLSGWLLPLVGWRSIFYFGGGGILVLGAILVVALPESIRVMAHRGNHGAQIRRYLGRIDPARVISDEATFYLDEETRSGASLRNLLRDGRAVPGLVIWLGAFFVNFVVYVFMQWLPSFVTMAGGGASRAGYAIGWFKMAGIAGSIVCAVYMDRWKNPFPVLAVFLGVGCASFLLVGAVPPEAFWFLMVIAASGFLLSGPQYANNALAARLFPTYVRTTGLAVTAGVGRLGALAGPFTVGVLLQMGWSNKAIFTAGIGPTLIAALTMVWLGFRDSRQRRLNPAV
jgi:AAHS family 4-hydroxybenzoate transporter-like MFS transporter